MNCKTCGAPDQTARTKCIFCGEYIPETVTKSVAYAYPTSPDAVRLKCGKTGCYTVCIHKGDNPPEAIEAFDSRERAEAYAAALVHPWNELYTRWHAPIH